MTASYVEARAGAERLELSGEDDRATRTAERVALALVVLLLALLTVFAQQQSLGLHYLRTVQLARHQAILDNVAPNPWQYRVLSAWILEGVFTLARGARVPDAEVVGQLGLRLAQNVALFWVAAKYYRALGIGPRAVLLGLAALAWSMSYMLHNSDLSFNTYFDGIFYLLGALAILRGREVALVPLVAVATLNRETAALLPAMLAFHAATRHPWRMLPASRAFRAAIAAAAVWLITFLGVRYHFGPRPWADWGLAPPGLPMLLGSLRDSDGLLLVGLTLNVLPLIAVAGFRYVTPPLRAFAAALVPIWFLVHFVSVPVNETRLFLVPIAVVFVPAALVAAGLGQARAGQLSGA